MVLTNNADTSETTYSTYVLVGYLARLQSQTGAYRKVILLN